MKKILCYISLLFLIPTAGYGQINFSAYADYGLEVINTPQDLDFNDVGPLIADGSTYSLDVHEGNYTIIEIVGVKYLDIYIDVSGPKNLTNTDNDPIDFTLKAAYSNQLGDVKAPASVPLKYINVRDDNGFNIRVPVLERQSQPPNPPPTPPTNATDLDPKSDYSNPIYETFYLYLYGDIKVPNNTSAGSYTGNYTITISYD